MTDGRTDGRTDRQTDGMAIAYARIAYMLSRAKTGMQTQVCRRHTGQRHSWNYVRYKKMRN